MHEKSVKKIILLQNLIIDKLYGYSTPVEKIVKELLLHHTMYGVEEINQHVMRGEKYRYSAEKVNVRDRKPDSL